MSFSNKDPIFGLSIPTRLSGVDSSILSPRNAWENKEMYDEEANKLANLFVENFKKYIIDQPELIKAGPFIKLEKQEA